MIHYYCTCREDREREILDKDSRGFRKVEACKDGICKNCGYYATASFKQVEDKKELYNLLNKDYEEQDETVDILE